MEVRNDEDAARDCTTAGCCGGGGTDGIGRAEGCTCLDFITTHRRTNRGAFDVVCGGNAVPISVKEAGAALDGASGGGGGGGGGGDNDAWA